MSCDCSPPSAYCASTRKARKPHRCEECRQEIKRGEQYQYVSGIWEGTAMSFKTCSRCVDLRDRVLANLKPDDCVPCIGQLHESARELGMIT